MVNFKAIRWKNFLSTGSAFTEIRLDRNDNTLIVGENGAGKSTILDALCYNLFGKPFRNINLPTLVNSINASDLITESEFVIGKSLYKVIRGMKPNIFEIYKDGKLIDQTGKIDYQEYLETFILRWNKKTFTQVVVLGNANFTPFMQLKALDRRAIIDDILDTQVFSIMSKLLKGRMDGVDQEVIDNKHKEDLIKKEVEIRRKHLDELVKNKQKALVEIDTELKQLNKDIKKLDIRIKSREMETISKSRDPILKEKANLEKKLTKFRNYQFGIESNFKKTLTDRQFWANTSLCPTCESILTSDARAKKLTFFGDEQHKLEKGNNEINVRIKHIITNLDHIGELNEKITNLNAENTKEISELKSLTTLANQCEKRKLELEKSQDDLDKTAEELADLQEKLADLEEKKYELLDVRAHFDVTQQLLKDSGIKARIIKQYLPIINKLVNKYLADQDFFVNFELDENFKEVIKSRYRDVFSYENFSEGEKQKIDMSLMLTWREIAKLKNSVATNILILDEIFDSSLDAQGVEYLMKLLHSLEKCNLFVISHKGDILQDKFKSVVKFEKQGNYSRIV